MLPTSRCTATSLLMDTCMIYDSLPREANLANNDF